VVIVIEPSCPHLWAARLSLNLDQPTGVRPRSLTTQRPALGRSDSGDDYSITAGPDEFLEKIFHLTYTLPDLTAEGVVSLVTANLLPATGETGQLDVAQRADDGLAVPDRPDGTGDPIVTSRTTEAMPAPQYLDPAEIAVAVTLTENDIATLRDVAPLLARSPRKVMRFYNILAVVRASINTAPELIERIQVGNGSPELLLAVALMTSLPPELSSRLREPVDDSITVKSWLTGLKTENQRALGTVDSFLGHPSGALETLVADLQRWIPHVVPWVSV
jgi:hypothetical protein